LFLQHNYIESRGIPRPDNPVPMMNREGPIPQSSTRSEWEWVGSRSKYQVTENPSLDLILVVPDSIQPNSRPD